MNGPVKLKFINLLSAIELSEGQLAQLNETQQLIYLKIDGEMLGCYQRSQLIKLLADSTLQQDELKTLDLLWANDLSSNQWHSFEELFDHDLQTQYFLFKSPEPLGPFSAQDVIHKLENTEILITDLISTDKKNWSKIYQLPEFDRRSMTRENHIPEQRPKVGEQTTFTRRQNSDTDIIASLAYVEKVRSGQAKESNTTDESQESEGSSPTASTFSFRSSWRLSHGLYLGLLMATISVFAIIFAERQSQSTRSPASLQPTAESRQAVSAPAPEVIELQGTPIDSQTQPNQQQENQRARTVQPTTPRPAPQRAASSHDTRDRQDQSRSRDTRSFRESDTYQNALEQRRQRERANTSTRRMRQEAHLQVITPEREDLYFDDNDQPLEHDPIRRELSRDVIDPVDDYGHYYDDYHDEADRAPAGLPFPMMEEEFHDYRDFDSAEDYFELYD